MNNELKKIISRTLKSINRDGNLRQIPELDHGADLYIQIQGQNFLNLASNNYLGLSNSQELIQASTAGASTYGASGAASRLITGNFKTYDQLEKLIASFKGQDRALAVGCGYTANLCILTALANRETVIFSDRLNHASIIDGAVLSRAKLIRYRHRDTDHLEWLIKKYQNQSRKFLITDTVFSMDGDLAPLEKLVHLCHKYNILSIVDEAHATGIFGQGRGLAHQLGLEKDIDIHMGTFSKALGSYGGYIASHNNVIELIINQGRAFIYSTSLPPAVVSASLASVRKVIDNPFEGARLLEMAQELKGYLTGLGFDTGSSSSQIIPLILKKSSMVMNAMHSLMKSGVYAAGIRPPTVPENTARLRISLRADMGQDEIFLVKNAFKKLAVELGL
ncbi:MAG: 8-amino-7-oxononanoate synthase [Desulfonatronovibrio sp. MSAO_Bac4]|nr:MAG: 8-amino-7-oxononanoate synthase [Desulfonatronovibrio sp. MSAO_Bac4]